MKFTRGMWLVALLASILVGSVGGYAQTQPKTQPTSITISPQNPTLSSGQTQQFTALSGTTLNFGESTAIAVGINHSCALLASGTVKCWGWNGFGQLGDGGKTSTKIGAPVAVTGLSGVVAITAGYYDTCALLSNRTAKCWGDNHSGQLGDGTKTDRSAPVAVLAGPTSSNVLSNVVAIAAGGAHTCALLLGGTVKCWGNNSYGQLGDGSRTDSTTPVAVSGLGGVVAIAAGEGHTCALLSDGTATCWGSNSYGQLGNGSRTDSTTPVAVSALSGAVEIDASSNHTCALLSNGTAKCWGLGSSGQLGDGSRTDRLTPVAVLASSNSSTALLSGVVAITAGHAHTCAVLADGTAKCWGDGSVGQLGVGYKTISTAPLTVSGLSGAVGIAASKYHTCALLLGGTVKCWGDGQSGDLGDGTYANYLSPVTVTGEYALPGRGSTDIAASLDHTCALQSDGTVKCWGDNAYGDLGDGTTILRPSPVAVLAGPNSSTPLSGAMEIAAGQFHSCALLSGGTVKCWGDDSLGELGVPGPSMSTTPLTVLAVRNTSIPLSGVVAISSEGFHTCALLASGTVKCWGRDDFGQLGNGTTQGHQTIPVEVLSGSPGSTYLTGVAAVAVGGLHTCALLSNGTVKCWGYNIHGELGNGKVTDSSTPVAVLAGPNTNNHLSGVVAIAAGNDHTCALLSNGTVKCWGWNNDGQLGDGSRNATTSPVAVLAGPNSSAPLSGVVAIAAGEYHTCAVLSNGTAKCWGNNDNGELGDGSLALFSTTPQGVTNLVGVVKMAGGAYHTCGLLANGTVKCWGSSYYGQLGYPFGLNYTVYAPPNSTVALVPSLVWTSSNHYVATIGAASGLATGVGTGSTTIKVTYGILSAQTTLTVP